MNPDTTTTPDSGSAMPTLHTLLLFAVAVLGLMVSPGPNMAMVVSQSLSHGARGGLVSAAGIFVADLVMTGLVCAGIASMAAAWPPSFDALRYLGIAYLAWLAIKSLRHRTFAVGAAARPESLAQVFRSATLVSLLNPKALLFFLVFLPQFVDPQQGNVGTQLLVLGLMLSTIALVFHGFLGLSSGRAASAFRGHPQAVAWLDRLHAAVLLGLAVRLLFLDRPIRP